MAAIVNTHLTNGQGSGASGSQVTSSISPSSNRFWTAYVRGRVGAGAPPTPALTGCGITWTCVGTSIAATSNGIWLFRGLGNPTAGALTIDFSGSVVSTIAWCIDEWANVLQTSGGIVQAVAGTVSANTSATLTLSPLAGTSNVAIGFMAQYNQIQTLTLGSGFSELYNQGFDGDDSWLAEYKLNDNNVTATSNGSKAWMGLVAELSYNDNNTGHVLTPGRGYW